MIKTITNTMNSNKRVITLSKLKIFLNIKCLRHKYSYSKSPGTNHMSFENVLKHLTQVRSHEQIKPRKRKFRSNKQIE